MLGRCRYVFAQAAHGIPRRNRSQPPPSNGNNRNSTTNHREFRSSQFRLLGKRSSFFDDRSRNVYENKQNVDNVKWKILDIHVEFIRILRTFPAMCGQMWLSARSGDRIKFKVHCAIWDAPIGGRARAKAGDFRARGHDMYEKAGTYVKFSKFPENVCY
jgi:hypothetical protein